MAPFLNMPQTLASHTAPAMIARTISWEIVTTVDKTVIFSRATTA